MARKRAKKATHRRHSRRRVGAVNVKAMGMKIAGVAGGAFLCRTLNNMAVKQFPTVDQKIIGIGDIVVGFFAPKFLKNEIGAGIGDAFLTIGSLTTLQAFGAINGMGAVPNRIPSRVIGAGSMPYLNQRVGATGKPFLRSTVGSVEREMGKMNSQAMGACMGSMFVEE
jgi:hypothetical protein